ncbi:MAG: class C sortase [Oscillospiraceae bacterium]|nr:class C sortase [Oscillospiraceae bacterium]
MRKKANSISTIILIIILLVGFSVMLYPTVSDWWNSKVQSRAVASYNEAVAQMNDGATERFLSEAQEYNRKLTGLYAPFTDYDSIDGYNEILNISGTGIMGYISIPVIKSEFPIYHGTSAEVLNIAAGHLQGSSFPVGGADTHAVISAHRGLPTAKLFTDLDKLVVGDIFTITILDRVYTYEVEEILIVKPEEIDKLAIIPGKDYVTLMTCTPYGVNTHRLLVRSHRIDTVSSHEVKVTADAVQVDPMLVVPLISVPLVAGLLFFWIFGEKKRKRITSDKIFQYKTINKKEEN